LTVDDEFRSVVQVMVAVVVVIAVAVTAEIVGDGVNVVNEKLPVVPVWLDAFVEETSY
jgi:hypothetical protein